jgi:6-phospho-3-hexuloisomerase
MNLMEEFHRRALAEIGTVMDRVDGAGLDRLCRHLDRAEKVVVYGCGREALQIKGLAMRLFHLGLHVAVVGDMACPPVGPGDLFLATSGPGELATVLALMAQAKKGGARTFVLTAEASGSAARQADHVLVIPAQTMASDQGSQKTSALPMGSLYEGALFVLFEVVVARLTAMRGATPEEMRARHTNLE